MIEYKQSVAKFVPVRIFNSSGDPVSGVAFGAVTATVQKSDNSTAVVTVGGGDWQEITTGAFASQGVYALQLPTGALDTLGVLTYAVATPGNKTYIGAIKVVANEEVDTYARVGAPVGASISADIASTHTRIGAPVGASISADIASTHTRIGAPVGASISADIASTHSRIGAPVGASISADIANVDSDLATLTSNVANLDSDVAALAGDVTTTLTAVQLLQKYEEGRWKIHVTGPDANRLVLYDTDNTTPLLKFDLKDSTGTATFAEPFERLPVP